jgi:maleate isomerase
MINARLMSDKPSMSDRLVDYFDNYEAALRQFANAPVGVVAAACTGASYLAGREREAVLTRQIEAKHGFPFITAALAVVDALNALKARKIGLVSPYPDDLNRASISYWQSHGFEVTDVANAFNTEGAFHPIYSLGGSAASKALRTLEGKPLDAIVMLGTGMPTLHPIADSIGWNGAPVMSCNLCLAWRAVEALEKSSPRPATLQDWLGGNGWVPQLKARQ